MLRVPVFALAVKGLASLDGFEFRHAIKRGELPERQDGSEQQQSALEGDSAEGMRRFLALYAEWPQADAVRTELARRLIHGYYACVSYTDAQIGKLLDELDRLELAENTIVVLWGDHGWNLGEHTLWCKHSCFETSMHAPLIVTAPGVSGGRKTKGLTEFIDIYPSLCELAGLPAPDHLEGRSFVPLMKNPEREWKAAAIGRFRNGDTIRTDRFRFTEYTNAGGRFLARMLYNHENDPEEDVNISEQPGSRSIVERLSDLLHERMGRDRKFNQP
jgi:iduronate 2-sulfatase